MLSETFIIFLSNEAHKIIFSKRTHVASHILKVVCECRVASNNCSTNLYTLFNFLYFIGEVCSLSSFHAYQIRSGSAIHTTLSSPLSLLTKRLQQRPTSMKLFSKFLSCMSSKTIAYDAPSGSTTVKINNGIKSHADPYL